MHPNDLHHTQQQQCLLMIVYLMTGRLYLILKQEAKRAIYRALEYNKPPFLWIGQGGHFCLLICPKNTNLVEEVEILLSVKFRWILFSGFRGEVENVPPNRMPERPSCFSDRSEKHKLDRGRWDLAYCQVSFNSVQWFQRRSRKCEKLTTDERTTGEHNSAFKPSAQVHLKEFQY